MSSYSFYLPDLGEGLQEAELVSWLVAVGDHVVEDQPLLTVETEKSLVEIPSPVAGRVCELHGNSGDMLPVGTLLAEIETGERTDAGAIVGSLPEPGEEPGRVSHPAVRPGSMGAGGSSKGVRAAPAVRAEARRLGIDLGTVSATGRDGSITLADLSESSARSPVAREGGQALRGLRRAMAKNMSRAWQQVAHATVSGRADVNAWGPQERPLVRLVRAVLAACAEEPALNAWFDADAEMLRLHTQVHLGIATDTAEGLLVPTLRDAQAKTAAELETELQQLQAAAAGRTLTPEQLGGQTISLSNFGAIAGEYAQMVVLPPQVAIVGAGRIQRMPVADGDVTAIHPLLPLSISFDHRVISGGEAARFLKALVSALERGADNEKENDDE